MDRYFAISVIPFDLFKVLALLADKLDHFREIHHANWGTWLTSRLCSQLG